jgi:hypothetical protein
MKIGDLGKFIDDRELDKCIRNHLFTVTQVLSCGACEVLIFATGKKFFFSRAEMPYIADFYKSDKKCP